MIVEVYRIAALQEELKDIMISYDILIYLHHPVCQSKSHALHQPGGNLMETASLIPRDMFITGPGFSTRLRPPVSTRSASQWDPPKSWCQRSVWRFK